MTKWTVRFAVACVALYLGAGVRTGDARAQSERREPEEPSFSADGGRIVFVQNVYRGQEALASVSEIWVSSADGVNFRRLTSGAKDAMPRFSPDGRRIVFTRNFDLWLIDADGANLTQLTKTSAGEDHPEFSLDGQSVAFLRSEARIDPKVLLAAGVQSLVLRSLSDGSEKTLVGDGYSISWIAASPLGGQAFFLLCNRLDANDKPTRDIFADKVIAVVSSGGVRTVYAPDAREKIAIKRMRITPQLNVVEIDKGSYRTEVAILDGGALRPISDLANLGDVSQDGKRIVGTGVIDNRFTWGLLVCDVESGKIAKLRMPTTVP